MSSIETKIKSAEQLISDVENKIRNWDERSMFKIKGVGNLSRADLDSILLYSETFIRNYGNFSGLMSPMGSVAEVFQKYRIEVEDPFSFL